MTEPTNCVKNKSSESNTVISNIESAQIIPEDGGFVKSVDKAYSDIADILTYTINLKNTGNTMATNILLTDTIPNGTSLVANSVTLNGASQPGVNIQNGLAIGTLLPNQVAQVTFKVNVNTIPSPNPIPNNSVINYDYKVNPTLPTIERGQSISNTVNTKVNHGRVINGDGGFVKYVDKPYAQVGDILTYTIKMNNTGSTTVDNIIFTDTIPSGTSLVPNSVFVNDINKPVANPQNGVDIGTIGVGATSTVVFKVKVESIPNPNIVHNSGSLCYTYTVDPTNNIIKKSTSQTNQVSTTINSAIIDNPIKTNDTYFKDLGDTITYNINFKNSGNVNARNVIVKDTIPSGTKFVEGSVTVNGINIVTANPQDGVRIGDVPANADVNLQFKVIVTTIPETNPVPNTATIIYEYNVDPTSGCLVKSEGTTNTVYNKVLHGGFEGTGGILKTVDKKYSVIGDNLVYTLNLKNTGNTNVNDVVIYDTIPNGTSIVPGSILVNGNLQIIANLQNGVHVGSLKPGENAQVLFKTIVDTIPNPNPIPNSFDVSYSYTVDPSLPRVVSSRQQSNIVNTQLNDAIIGNGENSFLKIVDKEYADVGETLTYTITLTNKGTVPGNNVVLSDTIPNNTTFIPNSVTINGTQLTDVNPQNGILIGTISPNQTVITSFKVTVDTVPSPNPIVNKARLTYNYTKDPSIPNGVSVYGTSNDALTTVRHGDIPNGSVIKKADKTISKRGDILTYTFEIPNKGNIEINNVTLVDYLQAETKFIDNSVTVNGNPLMGVNPIEGINIGTIQSGSISKVEFEVLVEEIPKNSIINNTATVNYEYTVNPDTLPIQKNSVSNETAVIVRDARIDFIDGGYVKSVDKSYAQLGDTLTYTLTLKNTGNIDALNLLIKDRIPDYTKMVDGSVVIDGTSEQNLNPEVGINIASLAPGKTITIEFKVDVLQVPPNDKVENIGLVSYEFINQPGKPSVKSTGSSNRVTTFINTVDFSGDNFKKSASAEYVAIGDIIKYSFNIANKGNIPAENVIFKDTIPEGAEFITGSIVLNGIKIPAGNPEEGINLQKIDPNQVNKLSFDVKVINIPDVNPMPDTGVLTYTSRINPNMLPIQSVSTSNTVYSQVNSTDIIINKETDSDSYAVDDIITYTLTISNKGNAEANNCMVRDSLPSELQFVAGSVYINGMNYPLENIINGINLGIILPNEVVTLTFQSKILKRPLDGRLTNQVCSNYLFTVDPSLPQRQGNTCSNINYIDIQVADLELAKTEDKQRVVLNEPITYTITIKNIGTVDADNVIIKDYLQPGLEFIEDSFNINGMWINGLNIKTGFNIGSLKPGQTALIRYQAKVVKLYGDCIVENKAVAEFNYRTSEKSIIKTKVIGPVSTKVQVSLPTFKQLDLDGMLIVPSPKPSIEEINDINVEIDIMSYHVIDTIKGLSVENRNLTGSKLVITGVIRHIVDYTADDKFQSNHSAYFERKFSTFIVLPEGFLSTSTIDVGAVVEDIYYKQINEREIFTNVTLVINANVLS